MTFHTRFSRRARVLASAILIALTLCTPVVTRADTDGSTQAARASAKCARYASFFQRSGNTITTRERARLTGVLVCQQLADGRWVTARFFTS